MRRRDVRAVSRHHANSWVAGLVAFALVFPWAALPTNAAPITTDILIDTNIGFTPANGVAYGSGTAADPYVIENLSFDLGAGDKLSIRTTRAFFVARNLTFFNGTGTESAIDLIRVENGRFENVTIDGAGTGVESDNVAYASRNITFESITVKDGGRGARFKGLDNITFSNSSFENLTSAGLMLNGTNAGGSNVTVDGCRFDNIPLPLQFRSIRSATIRGSSFNNTFNLAIGALADSTLDRNSFANTSYVDLTGGRNVTVVDNRFSGDNYPFLYLSRTRGMILYGNAFETGGVLLAGAVSDDFATHDIAVNNTVGNLPIVYRKGCADEHFDPDEFGQLILADCDRISVDNGTAAGSIASVIAGFSRNVSISGVSLDGGAYATAFTSCNDTSISASRLTNASYGVSATGMQRLTVNESFVAARTSVLSIGGTDIDIDGNVLEGPGSWAALDQTTRLRVSDNNFSSVSVFSARQAYDVVVSNNTWGPGYTRVLFGAYGAQVRLDDNTIPNGSVVFDTVDNITASGNAISGFKYDADDQKGPLMLMYTTNVTLENNTLMGDGVTIVGREPMHYDSHIISTSNTAGGLPILYKARCAEENATGGWGQIIFASCTHVRVTNASTPKDGGGLVLAYVDGACVCNATLVGGALGLRGINLTNATLRGSSFTGFAAGAAIGGGYLDVVDNQFQGLGETIIVPPCYECFLNSSVILGRGLSVGSTGPLNVMRNRVVSAGDAGIYVLGGGPTHIVANRVQNTSFFGISAMNAGPTTIAGNVVSGINGSGINVRSIDELTISSNAIANVSGAAIVVVASMAAEVLNNRMESSGIAGLYLSGSAGEVVGNAFVDNPIQANVSGSTVNWSAAYPVGGNYWSGYSGPDVEGGAAQDQAGADGIGDTPYVGPWGTDPLPLMAAPALAAPEIPDNVSNFTCPWELPNSAGGGSNETGGGSNETGGGSNETGGGSNQTGGGSNETGGGSNQTGGGANQTGGGSNQTGGGSNETGGASNQTGGGTNQTGGGSNQTGGASNTTGGGANSTTSSNTTTTPGSTGGNYSTTGSTDQNPVDPLTVIYTPPGDTLSSSTFSVRVLVTGGSGAPTVDWYWRISGSLSWNELTLTPSPDGSFNGTIQLPDTGGAVEYYFIAHDQAGSTARNPAFGIYAVSFVIVFAGSNMGVWLLFAVVLLLGAAGSFTQRGRYTLWWIVLLRLFPRLGTETVLGHFVRGRLFQVISQNPGVHFSELRRLADVASGTASHHLHVLEEHGYIIAEAVGPMVHFYPTKRPIDEGSYTLVDEDRVVFEAVTATPGLTVTDLASRLKRHPASVGRNVERLQRLGYLDRAAEGQDGKLFARSARVAEPR